MIPVGSAWAGLRGLSSVRAAFLAVFLLVLMAMPGVAVDLDPDVVKVLEQLALPVPDPANPIVCHGFGCAYRTPILLRNADKAQIKKLFGAAVKSAEEERKALAATMAWFEKRVAAEAGTATAKARAGFGHAGDRSQFDCLDKTSNTIGVFMIVADMGLLRHHVIDVPESRGLIIGGLPHTTAVVRERKGGQRWAIDGWTHANGELPDVLPLVQWRTQS
jgi:hypothetical protein